MSNISNNKIEIKKLRHRAEQPLKIVCLIFSLCVYALLTYLSIEALNNQESKDLLINYVNDDEGIFQPLIQYGIFFVIVALVLLYIIIIWKFFKNYGETISCDLPITNRQFSNLKDICTLYSDKLGIKSVPELYISQLGSAEIETSFMTTKSSKYIRLNFYYTMIANDTGNYDTVHFIIASELAHIALGHRNLLWVLMTLPARVLPFFTDVVSRTMNYSADAIAASLVGNKEAIEAIITLSNDPYIAQQMNKDAYVDDINQKNNSMHRYTQIYYNALSDISIPVYRIDALRNTNKNSGRLF